MTALTPATEQSSLPVTADPDGGNISELRQLAPGEEKGRNSEVRHPPAVLVVLSRAFAADIRRLIVEERDARIAIVREAWYITTLPSEEAGAPVAFGCQRALTRGVMDFVFRHLLVLHRVEGVRLATECVREARNRFLCPFLEGLMLHLCLGASISTDAGRPHPVTFSVEQRQRYSIEREEAEQRSALRRAVDDGVHVTRVQSLWDEAVCSQSQIYHEYVHERQWMLLVEAQLRLRWGVTLAERCERASLEHVHRRLVVYAAEQQRARGVVVAVGRLIEREERRRAAIVTAYQCLLAVLVSERFEAHGGLFLSRYNNPPQAIPTTLREPHAVAPNQGADFLLRMRRRETYLMGDTAARLSQEELRERHVLLHIELSYRARLEHLEIEVSQLRRREYASRRTVFLLHCLQVVELRARRDIVGAVVAWWSRQKSPWHIASHRWRDWRTPLAEVPHRQSRPERIFSLSKPLYMHR